MLRQKIVALRGFREILSYSFWVLAAGACLAAIYALSAQPTWTGSQSWMLVSPIRKSAHVVEFGALTALTWLVLTRAQERHPRFRAMAHYRAWIAFLFPFLVAVSDELHQYFVPNRTSQLMDLLMDVVGICLALGLLWAWDNKRKVGFARFALAWRPISSNATELG